MELKQKHKIINNPIWNWSRNTKLSTIPYGIEAETQNYQPSHMELKQKHKILNHPIWN